MLFEFGRLLSTPGALAACRELNLNPLDVITRHLNGDPGDLCEEDRAANARAITEGARIISAYTYQRVRFWVITEASREATTLLLPEEY